MMRSVGKMIGMVVMIAGISVSGWTAGQQTRTIADTDKREPTYLSKPLSYWLTSIRKHDSDMQLAFEAIRVIGADAGAAVPELTAIVARPFIPIEIGIDKPAVIAAKLSDIQLRGDAVDALAAIGEGAGSSSLPLIHWALRVRVINADFRSVEDDGLFMELVALDVLERMRVAGAVAQFGRSAAPALATLLMSSDGEQRKLAVAILSENTLPIAAALLKSDDCEQQRTGLAILIDMWPVVPKEHLVALKTMLVCKPQ